MTGIKLNLFGEIDIKASKSFDAELQLEGRTIELDLNLEEQTEGEWVKQINEYIEQIPAYKESVMVAIREDFDLGGDVKEYIVEALDGLPEEVITKLLTGTDPHLSKEEQLLSRLKLIRIGFYPGSDTFAVWDFTIGNTRSDITDVLVVVTTYPKGEINYVTWES